jgi:hypothetical protein
MRRPWLLLAIPLAVAPLVALVGVGCGSGAIDVQACQQIETARCNQAYKCPAVDLEPPYSTSGTDVQACIRFYQTACLHGLTESPPTGTSVSACVDAINEAGGDAACSIIEEPWTVDECAWLNPPAVPEASTDASDAGDAGDAAPSDASSSDGTADGSDAETVIGL